MAVKSEWFGDEIAKELERATREGLEKVGEDFVKSGAIDASGQRRAKAKHQGRKGKREAGG